MLIWPWFKANGIPFWRFSVNSPPILEPILVGIGMFTWGYDLDFCESHWGGVFLSGLAFFSHQNQVGNHDLQGNVQV